ncbi:MAG: type II secretion system protein M [Deltaproteobacteria bacterium]|jgi:general secretion pathway protein M|nr:type II secretion system protein M [Deltaproteobacteria bacterium]MBW2519773.1 type II secretion system protein M [Deltaproteobacteria bacterium]
MIKQLSPRERIFVFGGGFVVLLCLLAFTIVVPYMNAQDRLDKLIDLRMQQLLEVKALHGKYLDLKRRTSQAETTLDGRQEFSALTFIENLLAETAGRDRLVSMRPETPIVQNELIVETIEIKLEKLSLRQLLELFWGIDKTNLPIHVKNFHLKQRFDDRSLLDATLVVSALRRSA